MKTNLALQTHDLEKKFPGFHLGPLNLKIPTGCIYGLIGPNGAGKTTLIDLIFGMGAPSKGTIEVLQMDHRRQEKAVKARTALVSPQLDYSAWGRVERAMRFVKGFYPTWDDAYAEYLARVLDLNPADSIGSLSFGARTKLSVLLALAWKPDLVVLDEPTTGLDPRSCKVLFNELLTVVQDESRTVLFSSHQISELERFADYIGVLHKGQLVAEGAVNQLLQENFCRAEWDTNDPGAFDSLKGLLSMAHADQHCQAVIDLRLCPVADLEEKGGREVRTQALSLEELFLALTK